MTKEERDTKLHQRMVECCERLAIMAKNKAPIVILGAAAWEVIKILAAIDPTDAFKMIAIQIGAEDLATLGFCAMGQTNECHGDGFVERPSVYCQACLDAVAKEADEYSELAPSIEKHLRKD